MGLNRAFSWNTDAPTALFQPSCYLKLQFRRHVVVVTPNPTTAGGFSR
jgi:hypothetical protein